MHNVDARGSYLEAWVTAIEGIGSLDLRLTKNQKRSMTVLSKAKGALAYVFTLFSRCQVLSLRHLSERSGIPFFLSVDRLSRGS